MNITSYNISEISYHYIGLRVLAHVPGHDRGAQLNAVSTNVHKFVNDRALRLMLPAPRGRFDTIGERVCQELVHLGLAEAHGGYVLTESGQHLLAMLDDKRYTDLRRAMITAHIKTYDNLRIVLEHHMTGAFFQPVVTADNLEKRRYLRNLLEPSFGTNSAQVLSETLDVANLPTPAKIQDALRTKILATKLPDLKMRTALFRSICDRLASMRVLNKTRVVQGECEFDKTYSPSVATDPPNPWYTTLNVPIDGPPNGGSFQICLCEPEPTDSAFQGTLLTAIDTALNTYVAEAGYHHLADIRDHVCDALQIPDRAFDDGLNALLDTDPAPLSVGLTYEQITAGRRPLVRNGQLHNLIRRI